MYTCMNIYCVCTVHIVLLGIWDYGIRCIRCANHIASIESQCFESGTEIYTAHVFPGPALVFVFCAEQLLSDVYASKLEDVVYRYMAYVSHIRPATGLDIRTCLCRGCSKATDLF